MQGDSPIDETGISRVALDLMLRLGLLVILIAWCLQIVAPFIMPVVWAIIIAVAVHPAYRRLLDALGGRSRLAATLYTLAALALLISPTVMISGSLYATSAELAATVDLESMQVPPPGEEIRELPLVGERVYELWDQVAKDPEGTLRNYKPQLRTLFETVMSFAAAAGGAILQFVVSIVISGMLLATAEGGRRFSERLFARIVGERGGYFNELTVGTIRSVAQGVLGVALIQAALAALGMYVMDVPGWGLWTLFILILSVAQLPPLLVLAPVIVWVFSVADTTPATLFAAWSLLVSVSDGFLKPLLLGRGLDTPMLVILVGAIGGMLHSGIIGLFIGAVILALGYELLTAWLDDRRRPAEASEL